jgi:hypothetical protein
MKTDINTLHGFLKESLTSMGIWDYVNVEIIRSPISPRPTILIHADLVSIDDYIDACYEKNRLDL